MELGLLTFTFDGKERKCRRVRIGDYTAARENIRRQRLAVIPPQAAEVYAICAAQPVKSEELFDWMVMTAEGNCFLLLRCCQEVDQSFTLEEAEQMVLNNDPFVERLLLESKVIRPLKLTPSAQDSSRSDGAPGKLSA